MDGSGVGRGCCALMMHVIYKGRALPLAWRVRQCPKGHFPEDLHIALVELVSTLIPEGTTVVFLGDGEFDGIKLQEVAVTREAYGPVLLLCCWAKGYAGPLYLVSNMSSAEEAIDYYQKRFRIETFFSDQKSRGFNIQKSHLTDPQRLSRLLIASCLAYIWVVYLGSLCQKDGWQSIIHRRKRCDLSLFQLGLRLLEYFLNEALPIPVQFHIYI